MDTDNKRVRRNHSLELKARVLAECAAPGASVAKVAMAHGINANIVHGWRKLARQAAQPIAVPAFVPVKLEPEAPSCAPTASPCIDIELRRGALSVRIVWPVAAAAEFSTWMRDLLLGSARHDQD
jgi:transposase